MIAPKTAQALTGALENTSNHMPQRPPRFGHRLDDDPMGSALLPRPAIGNQAALRLLAQRQLVVGQPDDPLEHEADRVAEQVLTSDTRPTATGAPPLIQRRSSTGSADRGRSGVDVAPAIIGEVLRSPGRPLDVSARADFEPRFGRDFGEVRVHSDAPAAAAARSIDAAAFTFGSHIVFGEAQSVTNRRLLAHELTHVVQQETPGGTSAGVLRRAPKAPPQSSTPDEWVIHPEAMRLLGQKLRELYEEIPRLDRIQLKAQGTVAIGMATIEGQPRLVYTVNGNRASPRFRAKAESLGLLWWNYVSGVKGRGAVGAPNDAEQLMEGFAVDHEITLHGMVVSRTPCADCAEVIQSYGGGRLRVEYIPDTADLPNPRKPLARTEPAARTASGELPVESVFAQSPPKGMFQPEKSMMEVEPSVIVDHGGPPPSVAAAKPTQASGELPPRSVFVREPTFMDAEPPIIAADPALRGQVTKETETTHVESGTGMASGTIVPQVPAPFSTGTRVAAGALGVLTLASEVMNWVAPVLDFQRRYNARMEGTVRFFREFGVEPQFVMEDVDTHVRQPDGTPSDTAAVYGKWIAPRIESVDVRAFLAALPGRLTTMQSLVEFLGTGSTLQVIEQRGRHYFLTGHGIGYHEITDTVERIRSNVMRGLDQEARARIGATGGAGVYRLRSADATVYRYATGVRQSWRLRYVGVPNIATPEFSGANMWVREIGSNGDRAHVEPANAEAEGMAENAVYIVPMALGDVYDEVKGSGRKITSRQPAEGDGPLQGFVAAPLPPELGYMRYFKHPNPDWREFTIAVGDLRQFWVDRDDLEPVSATQAADYAHGTPAASPPTHFFRSEQRRDLPGF